MRKLLLSLILASQAFGASAFVRTTETAATGSSANTVVAAAQAHASGNLLAVFVAWTDAGNVINVSTITDTAGNTYTPGTRFFAVNTSSQIWYAKNITGNASNVVTVTFTATCAFRSLIVHEYSGLDTSAPFDVEVAPGHAANISITTGPFTTTNANDMLVLFAAGGSVYTAGAGYTLRDSTVNYAGSEDQHVTSIQTGATATINHPNGVVDVHLMAFKDAGGAATAVRHRVISQ